MIIGKKLLVLFVLVMGFIFFSSVFHSGSAQAQKAIEWKLIASWNVESPQVRNFLLPFVEKVNNRAAGRLKISWVGPEAVPSFEQLKPTREGLFDALYCHSAYHSGEVSVGQCLDTFLSTGKERRAAGLLKILDEAYRKKANVTYLGAMGDGVGYHLLSKKKIDKADLTGLKIRTSAFYDPMVTGLNGVPTRVAPGEVYASLEKGVVDGIMWTSIGTLDYKYYEVAKYMVRPLFGEAVKPLLVNVNSWNRLPRDLQDLLAKIAIETEEEGRATMVRLWASEEKELEKRGMEVVIFQPKEAEKYLNTFYERTWEELILKKDPEFGPRLKQAADRLIKK